MQLTTKEEALYAIKQSKLPPLLHDELEIEKEHQHIVYVLTTIPIIKQYPQNYWDCYDTEAIQNAEILHIGAASRKINGQYKDILYHKGPSPFDGLVAIARAADRSGHMDNHILQFIAHARLTHGADYKDFVYRHVHLLAATKTRQEALSAARRLRHLYPPIPAQHRRQNYLDRACALILDRQNRSPQQK